MQKIKKLLVGLFILTTTSYGFNVSNSDLLNNKEYVEHLKKSLIIKTIEKDKEIEFIDKYANESYKVIIFDTHDDMIDYIVNYKKGDIKYATDDLSRQIYETEQGYVVFIMSRGLNYELITRTYNKKVEDRSLTFRALFGD